MAWGHLRAFFLIACYVTFCLAFPVSEPVNLEKLPDSSFSCEGKVIGGYYADIESGCQMFHVCTLGVKGEIRDIKFLCLNGTIFDQETRVCERLDEVNCSQSTQFYDLNLDLFGSHGIILGRSASNVEGVIFDEEAQATSFISDDHYVDYDYTDDPTITAQSSNEEQLIQKFDMELNKEKSIIILKPEPPRIVNSTGVTITNGEPFIPLLRNKRFDIKIEERSIVPESDFSCAGRVIGGLYADVEAGCQVFHICTQGRKNKVIDHKFACGNGTLFDQASRTCQEAVKVNCALSEKYYYLNDPLKISDSDYVEEFEFHKEPKLTINKSA